MKPNPRLTTIALATVVIGGGTGLLPAGETDSRVSGADSEPFTLDRMLVTGSFIPVAGTSTAIPVLKLPGKLIEDTAISTNLLDVLRKMLPQFTGDATVGNSNAGLASNDTNGGSKLAFRGAQTLLLLNGRRLTYSPVLASGGSQFVDVNLIPLAAIERIEVLQDGASALYGSDAVAGVVNIILRRNYQGFEAGGRYAVSDNPGKYAERTAWLVGGFNAPQTDLTVSLEWAKSDPLFMSERSFSSPSLGGTPTFPGVVTIGAAAYVLNPALNAPPLNLDLTAAQLVANGTYLPVDVNRLISATGAERQYAFDTSPYMMLLLASERQAATATWTHRLPSVEIFGDLMYARTRTFSQLAATPFSAIIPNSDPTNPFGATSGNVRARNRLVDFPRQYRNDTPSFRGVVGLKGDLSPDWQWECAAGHSQSNQSYTNANLIDTAGRISAVSAGKLNLFARQQAAGAVAASGVLGTAWGKGASQLDTADLRVNGTLRRLSAGEVGFAAGIEWRRESLHQDSDLKSQTATFGWDSATSLDPLGCHREVRAGFINVRVPLLGRMGEAQSRLEVEAAARYERYTDSGESAVPKFTIRWLPFGPELALRGTCSESFAAPTLPQLFGPGGVGYSAPLSLARYGGGAPISGQANVRYGANPSLQPTTSHNQTLGVVWSPRSTKGLSVALDYFHLEQVGQVGTIGADTILANVEANGPASPYARFVRIDLPAGANPFDRGSPITAPGQIGSNPIDDIYVTDRLVNMGVIRYAGVDLKADLAWTSASWGRFTTSLFGTWWDYYRVQPLPTTTEVETIGRNSSYTGTIPRYQTYLGEHWDKGRWSATAGWSYVPKVKYPDGYVPADPTRTGVESFSTIDVSVAYAFNLDRVHARRLWVRLGANNVLNEPPPVVVGASSRHFDGNLYSPVGRLLYLETRLSF
jgi:iron complex outermembrane receptor protein